VPISVSGPSASSASSADAHQDKRHAKKEGRRRGSGQHTGSDKAERAGSRADAVDDDTCICRIRKNDVLEDGSGCEQREGDEIGEASIAGGGVTLQVAEDERDGGEQGRHRSRCEWQDEVYVCRHGDLSGCRHRRCSTRSRVRQLVQELDEHDGGGRRGHGREGGVEISQHGVSPAGEEDFGVCRGVACGIGWCDDEWGGRGQRGEKRRRVETGGGGGRGRRA
jgi:hypothetical protein